MKIIRGNIWNQVGWKVIPTNLSIRSDGLAVMGRGLAKQATDLFPHLQKEYGSFLKEKRIPELYFFPEIKLIMLPVKYRWIDKASLLLIDNGLQELSQLNHKDFSSVNLPLLGCGFGELNESEIMPLLEKYLDDRFTLVLVDKNTKELYKNSFRPGIRVDRSKVY